MEDEIIRYLLEATQERKGPREKKARVSPEVGLLPPKLLKYESLSPEAKEQVLKNIRNCPTPRHCDRYARRISLGGPLVEYSENEQVDAAAFSSQYPVIPPLLREQTWLEKAPGQVNCPSIDDPRQFVVSRWTSGGGAISTMINSTMNSEYAWLTVTSPTRTENEIALARSRLVSALLPSNIPPDLSPFARPIYFALSDKADNKTRCEAYYRPNATLESAFWSKKPSIEGLKVWASELLLGLTWLHSSQLIHGSVLPSTCVLYPSIRDQRLHLKLIDFGYVTHSLITQVQAGPSAAQGLPVSYMPPSFFEPQPFQFQAVRDTSRNSEYLRNIQAVDMWPTFMILGKLCAASIIKDSRSLPLFSWELESMPTPLDVWRQAMENARTLVTDELKRVASHPWLFLFPDIERHSIQIERGIEDLLEICTLIFYNYGVPGIALPLLRKLVDTMSPASQDIAKEMVSERVDMAMQNLSVLGDIFASVDTKTEAPVELGPWKQFAPDTTTERIRKQALVKSELERFIRVIQELGYEGNTEDGISILTQSPELYEALRSKSGP